ncbi:XLF-domain-containing protein [Xylaria digitata]|nr:XLF-domain-containing protein [Xylaria digitata]
MELPSKWYPLPVFPTLPALLVSTRFGESSYAIYVTDLANVWVEKLDRRGIIFRYCLENTSIDLLDGGPEQWTVFLSKLRAAFDPTSSDHHLTSLSIATATEPHSNARDGLMLYITCELPKPLNALKWPVHLVKCPPASLASELVLPLIQEHYARRREAEDLMSQLKEKDAVISKLLDKLSTMHAPLELIFNSLSAKHATTRAAAEERIKGLAPFDEVRWRSQRNIQSPHNSLDLLHGVFNDPGLSLATDMGLGVLDTLNDWWAKLGSGFHVASKSDSITSREEQIKQAGNSRASSGDIDDGDFQLQVTPTHRPSSSSTSGDSIRSKTAPEATDSNGSDVSDSHLTPSRNKRRVRIDGLGNRRMSTQDLATIKSAHTSQADEDDTASGTEDEEQPEPPKRTKKPNNRLGTIGRHNKLSQPTEASTTADLSVKANDKTMPRSDASRDSSPRRQSSPVRAPTTPRKGALGRIGGKPKDATGSLHTLGDRTLDTKSDNSTLPKKTEVRKIGAIGKKPQTEPKRLHSDTPLDLEEAETEEQKAERKRTELAKELNRQSAVPARKKRKF